MCMVFDAKTLDKEAPVQFFGHVVPDAPPELLGKQITWDLFELGFRQELDRLDQHLAPVPRKDDFEYEAFRQEILGLVFPGGMRYNQLPSRAVGLAASDIRERAKSLEGLRRLMIWWRTASSSIKKMPPLLLQSNDFILQAERRLARFYVQQFFETSGRAAVIPHIFPAA